MSIDWRMALMYAMARRGYPSSDLRDAVRYAERWGTLRGCPVLSAGDREALEHLLPGEFDPATAAGAVCVEAYEVYGNDR